MTTQEAIEYLLNPIGKTPEQHVQFEVIALTALREKQERENPQPLKTSDFWERIGKPIWIYSIINQCINCAVVFYVDHTWSEAKMILRIKGWDHLYIEDYGKTWLAYDHEPKRSE